MRAGQRVVLQRNTRWWLLRLVDKAFRRLATERSDQRILLHAASPLMADYVLRAFESLGGSPPARGFITQFDGRSKVHDDAAQRLDLSWVSAKRAVVTPWDLIILADHAPFTYAPSLNQVILPHGPGPSRHVRGGSYYYDRQRALWPDGSRVYALMLDTADHAIVRALSWLPEYEGHLRSVGDLRADDLYHAHVARNQHQSSAEPPSIAVMSTWGPHGLLPRHGKWVVPAVKTLMAEKRFKFVVTMHNNLWDVSRAGTSKYVSMMDELRAAGAHVVARDEDWSVPLAQTDAAIVDHTSLSAVYSILNCPMIPVSVPPNILTEGTFSRWIMEARQPVEGFKELVTALDNLAEYSLDGAPRVIDHIGNARQRTAQAIREVL